MVDECSDLDLVDNLKHNINIQDSLYELINRHSGIFYDMVNNYTVSFKNTYHLDEIKDDIEFLFYRTCLRYQKERGTKFSTFLGNETKYHCLNFYNKNKKYYLPQEKEIPILEFEKINAKEMFIDPNTVDKIFSILKKHPDQRVSQIFEMRYLDPDYNKLTPWRKVGKKLNLSIQGCINIHNQALPYIRKHLSKHEINL